MTWIALVIYVVAAYGFALVAGHSKITKPIRAWAWDWRWGGKPVAVSFLLHPLRFFVTLVECVMCLGFWTGVVAGAVAWGMNFSSLLILALPTFTAASNYILATYTLTEE